MNSILWMPWVSCSHRRRGIEEITWRVVNFLDPLVIIRVSLPSTHPPLRPCDDVLSSQHRMFCLLSPVSGGDTERQTWQWSGVTWEVRITRVILTILCKFLLHLDPQFILSPVKVSMYNVQRLSCWLLCCSIYSEYAHPLIQQSPTTKSYYERPLSHGD